MSKEGGEWRSEQGGRRMQEQARRKKNAGVCEKKEGTRKRRMTE